MRIVRIIESAVVSVPESRRLGRVARNFVAAALVALVGCNHAVSPQTESKLRMNPPASVNFTNRLANSASPYLIQHQYNPVDWYEWGDEALERARRENKPIFLSIGYSACHWCHVMAHECFENAEIAEVMNRLFVNIKVDREERPDLDAIYMQATMILNQGQGGWPMSVWLTPDLRPFFAGTYFPPESRWGRPGFPELCERIGQLWREKRDALSADAAKLTGMVVQSLQPVSSGDSVVDLEAVDHVVDALTRAFDQQRGGLLSGSTNKFPPSMTLDLMLRRAKARGAEGDALRMVRLTLDNMARGGITDQLAGGICRYSTDTRWLVPHFEKMLYDQALVSRIYVDAWLATGDATFERAARGIFDYVLADLTAASGAFFSARDADSEGEEGKYYVWTREEIVSALGEQDGALICEAYGVTSEGNWDDPHAQGVPKNVLHLPMSIAEFAASRGMGADETAQRIAAASKRLLDVRAKRVPPGLDDKVLCEWNGLMISSLARGGMALGEDRYVAAAARAARFVLETMCESGRLRRAWRDGRAGTSAFLTDYAAMIEACIDLYEATFDVSWWREALSLQQRADELFWDTDGGGYFFTAGDHETLIARSKELRDSATPSGNSVMLMNLLRIAAFTGAGEMRAKAERVIATFAGEALGNIGASERFLQAVDFALTQPMELAIVGSPGDIRTQALLRAAYETYLPNRIVALLNPSDPAAAIDSPLLRGRVSVDGAPAAYVCRSFACRLPVKTPEELKRQLATRE